MAGQGRGRGGAATDVDPRYGLRGASVSASPLLSSLSPLLISRPVFSLLPGEGKEKEQGLRATHTQASKPGKGIDELRGIQGQRGEGEKLAAGRAHKERCVTQVHCLRRRGAVACGVNADSLPHPRPPPVGCRVNMVWTRKRRAYLPPQSGWDRETTTWGRGPGWRGCDCCCSCEGRSGETGATKRGEENEEKER